jgi:hypothetical protein
MRYVRREHNKTCFMLLYVKVDTRQRGYFPEMHLNFQNCSWKDYGELQIMGTVATVNFIRTKNT